MKLLKAKLLLLGFLLLVGIFAIPLWLWNLGQVFFSPVRALKGCRAWDITGATIAWGSTDKTISYKTAMASKAGNWLAQEACKALSEIMSNHCELALTNKDFTIQSLE